jgi:hypothetical protein
MSVSFQEINPVEIDAQWSKQPFQGFSLDSRKSEHTHSFATPNSVSLIIASAPLAKADSAKARVFAMSVSFQEINPVEIDAQWSKQPFQGFSLDSRKVVICYAQLSFANNSKCTIS